MKILLLKENKQELRVSLVPTDVAKLVTARHLVFVEAGAGSLAGFKDVAYAEAGAKVIKNVKSVLNQGVDFIFKISNPTTKILKATKPETTIVGLFNAVNNPKPLYQMLKLKNTSVALEAIEQNGYYPLIVPNEQVKGRLGALIGAYNLTKLNKHALGKTIAELVHNEEKAHFVILHLSYACIEAAKAILALGSDLTILASDYDMAAAVKDRHDLKTLASINHCKFEIVKADFTNLNKHISTADVLINTNPTPGSLTPKRITTTMINAMPKGSVFVDLAIDQGFSSDTEKKPTTIKKPTEFINGVTHFYLENTASLFPHSLSKSISSLIMDIFFKKPSTSGIETIKNNEVLYNAILTYDGKLTNKLVSETLHIEGVTIKSLLK
ncbi:alanine dehydrogenase [Bacilli bacterium]|nr:alanine dehydrogenase [Bacilli bacterium]